MNRVRVVPVVVILGLSLILGGVISMAGPLALHVVDTRQQPIACGSGWQADTVIAAAQDQTNRVLHQSDSRFALSAYADDCRQMVDQRRSLAVATVAIGLLLVGMSIFAASGGLSTVRNVTRRAERPLPAVRPGALVPELT